MEIRKKSSKFSKSARLLTKADYARVSRRGIRMFGQAVTIDYCFGKNPFPRLGITVTKKYGKAHLRNRFKRLVRESFRRACLNLPCFLEVNVRPKEHYQWGHFKEIQNDLSNLLLKLANERKS